MALWVQELQVIHYCSSASRMAIENTDQRKNCKKQGPDPAAPCMPCQGNWNLSIPWWEALKFWREKQDEIRKVTPWSKEKKELGRIWKVTSPTKRQIGRGLFFCPSWCPLFPLPPTASTPYSLPVRSDHHTLGFYVERRLLILLCGFRSQRRLIGVCVRKDTNI